MITINYERGQERDIVIETGDFGNSIFTSQYKRALSLILSYMPGIDKSAPRIIAFCGERGEGKTSCMTSVLEILNAIDRGHNRKKQIPVDNQLDEFLMDADVNRLAEYKFSMMPVIDPAFFDDNHNVLEIVIGHMYNRVFLRDTYDHNEDAFSRRSLEKAFQRVKKCLQTIVIGQGRSIDELHELGMLASAINLREEMEKLVECYLAYTRADALIVPIDDIDLSMNHAYDMCEELRKYLCVKRCIVMTCVKVAQLQDAISGEFHSILNGKVSIEETQTMAKKYIDKLLPVSSRIDMPKAYTLSEIPICIKENGVVIDQKENLRNGVLELIFNRTRYLFYNPAGGVSPIVPNNLRDLFNLIGLLASMPPVDDSKSERGRNILADNKKFFKHYMFLVWKNRFDNKLQAKLDELINFDFGTSFNRQVVSLLVDIPVFKTLFEKDYSDEEDKEMETDPDDEESDTSNSQTDFSQDLITGITDEENFGYNVTIGDVFYLFSLLEKETLAENDFALVFFLKSLYSIRLYEIYEEITENHGRVYPETKPTEKGLTVTDDRFDHTNHLQQLVGGSYFTYFPGELLPSGLDLQIIEGTPVNQLIREVKKDMPHMLELCSKEQKSDEENVTLETFALKLRLMEFLMLITKASVRRKHREDHEKPVVAVLYEMRCNVVPFHYRNFSSNTGYFLMDVMAPFANILNIEFAYKRFPQVTDEFYRQISAFPDSLINQIADVTSATRQHIHYEDDPDREKMHRILSDSAIRNAEVLTAVKEKFIVKRLKNQDSVENQLMMFYGIVQKSEMSTHKINDDTAPYSIDFHFLQPLSELMRQLIKPKEGDDEKAEELRKLSLKFKRMFGITKTADEASSTPTVRQPSVIERIKDGHLQKILDIIGPVRSSRGIKERLRDSPLPDSHPDLYDKLRLSFPANHGKYDAQELYETVEKAIESLPVNRIIRPIPPLSIKRSEPVKETATGNSPDTTPSTAAESDTSAIPASPSDARDTGADSDPDTDPTKSPF